jgi:cyclic pyranopterin phosphate synthase
VNAERAPLVDRFGRHADDLRISVTDRCNFRCVYCMPSEGLPWMPRSHLLSFEEITRVARVFVSLGVKTIRLTGGEPTMRRDLPKLVSMLSQMGPGVDLAMTTNGFLLGALARPLADAGLTRINVSLDSLLEHRFRQITRREALETVMGGIRSAEEAGLSPLKINCVVVRGQNDDEILDFARLARDTGWEVRFIEFMPLDAGRSWDRSKVVSAKEILDTIGARYGLLPAEEIPAASQPGSPSGPAAAPKMVPGRQPATLWRFADGAPGSVGVIPSVTAPFCGNCNRLRLTADGQLRTCLFSLGETDLKALVRGGSSDEDLEAAIRQAVWGKEPGHRINEDDFVRPERSMSMIGG